MPISPDHYLQATSDGYICVRSADGALLGCIPYGPPQDDFVQTAIGQMEVRAALTYCLVPDNDQLSRLRDWPGFIPISPEAASLRPLGTGTADDQSDLGQPI